jgi:hypothetical protein
MTLQQFLNRLWYLTFWPLVPPPGWVADLPEATDESSRDNPPPPPVAN